MIPGLTSLVSADDWEAIQEMLFLLSVPGMCESIRKDFSDVDKTSFRLAPSDFIPLLFAALGATTIIRMTMQPLLATAAVLAIATGIAHSLLEWLRKAYDQAG